MSLKSNPQLPIKSGYGNELASTDAYYGELLSPVEAKSVSIGATSEVEIIEVAYDVSSTGILIAEALEQLAKSDPENLKYVKQVTWRRPIKVVILPPELDIELK